MESLTKPAAGKRRKVHQDQTAPEPREAQLGDNSGEITDETILMFVGKIRQEEAKCRAARKRLGAVKKLAINNGLVMKDLYEVMQQSDMEPEKVAASYARKQRYGRAMDVPIARTMTLLDFTISTIPKTSELSDLAYRKGFALGILGKNPDAQAYPVGNEFQQDHMRGWGAGQKVLLDKIKPIDEALDEVERKALSDEAPPEPEAPAAPAEEGAAEPAPEPAEA